jgi:hypothetical protein
MTLFEGWKLSAGNWVQSAPGPGMHPFTHSMGFAAKKSDPPKALSADAIGSGDARNLAAYLDGF